MREIESWESDPQPLPEVLSEEAASLEPQEGIQIYEERLASLGSQPTGTLIEMEYHMPYGDEAA